MKNHLIFVVADSLERDSLIDTFNHTFKTSLPPASSFKRRYYDTFDWRLYQKGLALFWQQGSLELYDIIGSTKRTSTPWSLKTRLGDINSLPNSMLREILAPIIDIRALLLLATPSLTKQRISILNNDLKSVARISLEAYYIKKQAQQTVKPFLSTLKIEPIRGYDSDARQCLATAHDLALSPSDEGDILNSIYGAFSHTPLSYSSKLTLALTPDTPVATAALALFQSQLAIMEINEAGIEADSDTEFLHDFRVALRRTRAGLSEIKNVFSTEVTRRFKTQFKDIGSQTNRLRDLDVYLLKKEYYKSLLPAQLQSDLSHLFHLLEKERDRELQQVKRLLNSAGYKKTINEWGLFLNSFQLTDETSGANAHCPTQLLAKKFIYKRWKMVIKLGRAITPDSPDGQLHSLRLECKKLRYLLEFFISVFHETEIKYLIKQLKQLQENLGDFNDLYVQQETLHEYLANQVGPHSSSLNIAAAIGGLITNLNQKQQEVRALFETSFQQFDQKESCTLFQKTFKKTRSGERTQ